MHKLLIKITNIYTNHSKIYMQILFKMFTRFNNFLVSQLTAFQRGNRRKREMSTSKVAFANWTIATTATLPWPRLSCIFLNREQMFVSSFYNLLRSHIPLHQMCLKADQISLHIPADDGGSHLIPAMNSWSK